MNICEETTYSMFVIYECIESKRDKKSVKMNTFMMFLKKSLKHMKRDIKSTEIWAHLLCSPILCVLPYDNTVLRVTSRGSKNQFTIIELASTEVLTSEVTVYFNWDQLFYMKLSELEET